MRDSVRRAFDAAVEAVDPERSAHAAVVRSGNELHIGEQAFAVGDDTVLVGIGKAAPAMARGVAAAVGRVRGLVVSDHVEPCPVELMIGGHPIPDEGSIAAGRALRQTVQSTKESDVLVFVISGGGSAVAEIPTAGVDLDDLAATNEILVRSGLPIGSINEIRASISDLKGGRLLEAAGTHRAVTLVLSDVVGAGPGHVASGPTLGQGLGGNARHVVSAAGLEGDLPPSVLDALGRDVVPAADHPFMVIGSPEVAADAALDSLRSEGIDAEVITTSMSGDVVANVDAMLGALEAATAVVAAGEATVTVSGDGLGGRNQHAALVAAERIRGKRVVFGTFGTDGRDGPTSAAGAIVDGSTIDRMRSADIDPLDATERFDSHRALAASGDLVITGPTGTNVADVWIAIRVDG